MSGTHEGRYDGSEIAVCGMAGRFPGAPDIHAFWRNLCAGIESISAFTEAQVLEGGEEAELVEDPAYVPARGILEGAECFDASFFGFAPREAEILDPQQRLLLECAWEALEHAGVDAHRFKGAIGLMAGGSLSTYLAHNLYRNEPVMKAFGATEATIYNSPGAIATMVAYKLNLKGATSSVQTFCSTSLVAVHLACQSLLNYEVDLALAGGVTLYVPQIRGYVYQQGNIVSPDGHCRAFDAEAAGTVFGNGVGVVVLRRLKDALAAGDTVHAIIRGSAINNDGSLKVSYTAPSVSGQAAVVVEALAASNVEPDTIGYVEAHGTGTRLGDPAEVEALTKAYRTKTDRKGYCAIGSVKGNIGHLDAAAGVTGLIKTVLCLKHGRIPASLHVQTPNPLIDFASSPFHVNASIAEWPRGSGPRRAAVSAFGIGGTNAHVVLEEAPEPPAAAPSRDVQLILLSAKTVTALDEASRRLAAFLRENPAVALADVAYTLQVGRREFAQRRMLLAEGTERATALLETLDPGQVVSASQDQQNPPVVFVFPGTPIPPRSVRALYQGEDVFARELEAACTVARRHTGLDVKAMLLDGPPADGAGHDLAAEVALLVAQHAFARLWMAWGIRPEAVAGSGAGEFAAACVAGVLSLEDAVAQLAGAWGASPFTRAELHRPKVPLLVESAGGVLTDAQATDPARWTERPRSHGRLQDVLKTLPSVPHHRFALEVVPQDGPRRVLQTLGRLWLAGVDIDWAGFYSGERRRRVPLPMYPFERIRYWVEPEKPAPAPVERRPLLEKDPDIGRWFYVPGWRQAPPARCYAQGRELGGEKQWLVFERGDDLSSDVIRHLEARVEPARIVKVLSGDRFARVAPDRYTVRAEDAADYAALFDDLERQGKLPDVVAHLWEAADPRRSPSPDAGAPRPPGFYSVVLLAQALTSPRGVPAQVPVALKVVTSHAQAVIGSEGLRPEQATVIGACLVIPQEHAHLRCCAIDVAPGVSGGDAPEVVARLIAEELVADTRERLIAYRAGRRWLPFIERIPPDATVASGQSLRPEGAYLITGGFGSIGRVFARHLARSARARLALVTRTPLPERDEWDRWLDDHAANDSTSSRIGLVRELEQLGAEVMVAVADVADLDAMATIVGDIVARFGPIAGVISAAGAVDESAFAPVARIRPGDCDAQFRPKMAGLAVLEKVLAGHEPGFCLVVSSLSSVLGGLGYAGYAAANIYMDTFVARHNQRSSQKWLAVNWDAWTFDQPLPGPAGGSLARLALTPAEGVVAFDRLLTLGHVGQVIVSTANLYERIKQWVELSPSTPDESAEAPGRTLYARPASLEASFEVPRDRVEQAVAAVWQQVLGIDRIGRNDDFFELGGHSLLAVQVAARLEAALHIDVPIRNVFDAPTVADLSKRIQLALADMERAAVTHADVEEVEI